MTKIILDSTNLYPPNSDYIIISNEVEWLKYFTLKDKAYWIKGKTLCLWTEEWLKLRNKTELIIEKKENPRYQLESILAPFSIPNQWNNQEILEIVIKLNNYKSDNYLDYFLAEISHSKLDLWQIKTPSINHLAQWLSISIPEKYQVFENTWINHLTNNNINHELIPYYQPKNKYEFLKNWLGIGLDKLNNLGKYPLTLPESVKAEFTDFWQKNIYKTEAKILDELNFSQQYGSEIIKKIAEIIYDILTENPQWINQNIVKKISIYLNKDQHNKLIKILPPLTPKPLEIETKPQECLSWVTNEYLPFRLWEITNNKKEKISDKLAENFVNWIVKYYPELKLDNVDNSLLNYNVTSQVQKLTANHPVLWVVIDGLGWLDHQDLINILTKNQKLSLEQNIEPRFSILPTKTEYAKWSLFTQLLPDHSSWKPNVSNSFFKIGQGKHYTDKNKPELIKDLPDKKYQLYCWDTIQLDKIYHQETDWETLYKLERNKILEGIAKDILHFLEVYPEPENLKIVIASDHGQIIGKTPKISDYPPNLEAKGRMAIGKTNDERFVVLESQRFAIPHDISIVKNADCLNSFYSGNKQEIIGSHGGLFPEEVVIGFSILAKNVQRFPVIITCKGEGEANKKGELEIIIINPNSVSLINLCLYINEIPEFKGGKNLDLIIPAKSKISQKISILSWPQLLVDQKDSKISLSGQLVFNFPDHKIDETKLDSESLITIKQIFSSGIKGGLDDFF